MPDMHQQYCQVKAFNHEDAARRISDTYNLHRIGAGNSAIGRWFAARLDDGRSDDTLYDSMRDAVLHQRHNEKHYTFIRINPNSMSPCDAAVMLKVKRGLANVGMRMADPDDAHGGRDVIRRLSVEDQAAQAMGVNTNLRMPWEA
jgi:hypothetical protein